MSVCLDLKDSPAPFSRPNAACSWEGGPSTSELLQQALPDTAVFKGGWRVVPARLPVACLSALVCMRGSRLLSCCCWCQRSAPRFQPPISLFVQSPRFWDHQAPHIPISCSNPQPCPPVAFSTVGVEQLAAPDGALIGGQQLTMLLAGGPPERRGEAEAVVAGVGFAPKYVGPIRYARNLDAIAELWQAGRAACSTVQCMRWSCASLACRSGARPAAPGNLAPHLPYCLPSCSPDLLARALCAHQQQRRRG